MTILLSAVLVTIGVVIFIAFSVSPKPGAHLIRILFNKKGRRVNQALASKVPATVSAVLNEQYDLHDPDAFLDLYYPTALNQNNQLLTTVVWIHGGGWVAGDKEQTANYCKILAARGFIVVAIDYSLAPEKNYPLPVRQANAALAYLTKNALRLHIDKNHFVLAGDSGGAHIAAQVANLISSSGYATLLGISPALDRSDLAGIILYCGPYDTGKADVDGALGRFVTTVLWSYSGTKDFMHDPYFATANLVNYLTKDFPPTFISVGNDDPLAAQSYELADDLRKLGVSVDTLFFRKDDIPSLPHEYQFNLDIDAGKMALDSCTFFLVRLSTKSGHKN
jgi:acetyl esterase/lipase